MAVARYSTKELTKHLRALAVEAETMTDSGEVVTKAEALARILWKKALGYTANELRAGQMEDVVHPPEAWAIQMVYERLEGKTPNAATDDGGKISAADRVSDLAKNRINALAGANMASKSGPPKLPRKDK